MGTSAPRGPGGAQVSPKPCTALEVPPSPKGPPATWQRVPGPPETHLSHQWAPPISCRGSQHPQRASPSPQSAPQLWHRVPAPPKSHPQAQGGTTIVSPGHPQVPPVHREAGGTNPGPLGREGSGGAALAPTCVYPPVSFEVGALGVDLIAALKVTLVDSPLLQVRGIGSLAPRRRPAGSRERWRDESRTHGPTQGSRGTRWGGHARRLTLAGGPGKGLGRSPRRCPRCRCSCP